MNGKGKARRGNEQLRNGKSRLGMETTGIGKAEYRQAKPRQGKARQGSEQLRNGVETNQKAQAWHGMVKLRNCGEMNC